MRFSPGYSVGPYAIESLIGSGGMGEVYKARDTRLGRLVAIKTAKENFSDRFQREAHAISSLNHPRICTLYDVGPDYLVMEYVDGKPLTGPLPTEKAITYALQILDALDAAHRHRIVHRDLKPANVLVTDSGVKLLDFGLAKIRRAEDSDSGQTQSLISTGENVVLGTPQYMAPEQIAGEEADARSDIFAFGCVFYELLTGKKAFGGDSPRTVMAAIVTTEPRPVRELKPDCPPAVQFVLDRCFDKDRDQRWQSAHDVKLALETALREPHRQTRTSMRWPIATCIIASALAPAFYFIGQRAQPHPATRLFTIQLARDIVTPAKVSPDGQSIAVVSDRMLTIRRLDSITAKPVPDSDDATYPFWSPDSQQIAFFSGGKLKRAEAAGGPTRTLADAPEGYGGAWWQSDTGDGFIVFAPSSGGGLFRVGTNGGQTTPVTQRAEGENRHRLPLFLPDGRLLYDVQGASDRRGTVLASLNGNGKATNQRLLLPGANAFGYVQSGLLVFSRGTLLAQRFDLRTSQLLGPAFPISTEITPAGTRVTAVSISADGKTAAFTLVPEFIRDLMIVNRDGSRETIAPSLSVANLRLSPDSNKLALTLLGESLDVWVHDLARDTRTRLTSHASSDGVPTWSPDGRFIAFATIRDGTTNIYVKEASGESTERALVRSQLEQYPTDWSPDGQFLLYQVANVQTGWDLHVARLRSDLTVSANEAFRSSEFNETQGRFSPDGRYVAHSSNETGRPEIYVCRFPNGSGKTRISRDGGWQPEWSADGRELYFLAPDGMLMQVSTNAEPTFTAGVPRKLVATNAGTAERAAQYAVAGARFIVISRPTQSVASVAVALNWRDLAR